MEKRLEPGVVKECEAKFFNYMVHEMDRLCQETERDMLDYVSAANSNGPKVQRSSD